MTPTRYEVRVNGRLSERARGAFYAMDVTSVPEQTIVFGSLPELTDLAELLSLCSSMGLEIVSVRRLPSEPVGTQGRQDHPATGEFRTPELLE